ncbi:secretogranin-1 isoform X1 [Pelobates cultripes]|uniref:Secretogranin-1 n=2 Tax=Pelobates cultripes TaxID=61616 RepID=A0AAD1VWH8_PELCU|nr:secretogranin-1 isoform X1 [Pelobates cultripes]
MLPTALLVSLLLGILEVGALPLDKGEHPEEMVTRCIVEVLSNALAKPNAPPIDPECKEILKKSTRPSNNEQLEEANNFKEMTAADKHLHEFDDETGQQTRESKVPKEQEEEKRHHEGRESQEEKDEEEGREKNIHSVENEEDTGHSKESDFEDGEEERGEMIKKDKFRPDESHDTRHDVFDKKVHTAAKNVEEFSEDDEPRSLEDIIKRHHGGLHWKEQLGHPEEHSSETSDESKEKEEEEKRNLKSKLGDFGQRILGYDEKRRHELEQRSHTNLHEEQPYSRVQKGYYGINSFEDNMKRNHYDKRTHHEVQSSEESKEKRHFHRGSVEEREEPYDSESEESKEKELKRHHLEEEENNLQKERKRWPTGQHADMRLNYGRGKEDNEESKDDIDKRHFNNQDEKQKLYEKLKHHLQADEEEQPYSHGIKDNKRHYIGEEMVDEMKRYYPDYSDEKEKRHYNEELKKHYYGANKENTEESNYLNNEKYNRHSSEEERQPDNHYGFTDDQIKWKKFFDNDDDNFLDSEEESKRSIQNKNVLPEYNDYDWWGKKQFLEDMNHGYEEKRMPQKYHKFEEKRQYDRMDELAQLLNYKKKSVEIPDFYDSEEIKKRNFNERDRLSQRPLTEEEEKELENLAIMDMELQKIAEKLTNNRQG